MLIRFTLDTFSTFTQIHELKSRIESCHVPLLHVEKQGENYTFEYVYDPDVIVGEKYRSNLIAVFQEFYVGLLTQRIHLFYLHFSEETEAFILNTSYDYSATSPGQDDQTLILRALATVDWLKSVLSELHLDSAETSLHSKDASKRPAKYTKASLVEALNEAEKTLKQLQYKIIP